jgi:hypothetical protein
MVLLAEFDGQRRRMTSHEPQPVPPPLNAPASVSIAR